MPGGKLPQSGDLDGLLRETLVHLCNPIVHNIHEHWVRQTTGMDSLLEIYILDSARDVLVLGQLETAQVPLSKQRVEV